MAIVADRIAEIKAKLDLYEEVVRFLGPPRRLEAGIARWCCPWHDEKTPSFGVNLAGPHVGRWRCWGACSEGGDVLDFLARMNNSTLKHEIEKLSDGAVTKHFTPPPRPRQKTAKIPQQSVTLTPVAPTTPNHPALNRLPEWYEHRSWDPDLAELIGLEFVVDGRGNPRIRFPFRRHSPAADPCFFQDRAMFSTMSPKWMAPTGQVPCPFEAWRMDMARRYRTVFICEGLPDVMALLHFDPNLPVIGVPGAGAFKSRWARCFRGITNFFLLADNDKAGEKMRLQVAGILDAVANPDDIHQLYVPGFKDVDEWRQFSPDCFPGHFMNVLAETMERDGAQGQGVLGLPMGPGRGERTGAATGAGNLHGCRPIDAGHSTPGVGGLRLVAGGADSVCGETEDRQIVDVTEHRSLCDA